MPHPPPHGEAPFILKHTASFRNAGQSGALDVERKECGVRVNRRHDRLLETVDRIVFQELDNIVGGSDVVGGDQIQARCVHDDLERCPTDSPQSVDSDLGHELSSTWSLGLAGKPDQSERHTNCLMVILIGHGYVGVVAGLDRSLQRLSD